MKVVRHVRCTKVCDMHWGHIYQCAQLIKIEICTFNKEDWLISPRGLCEAHLHLAYKCCVTGALPLANLRRPPPYVPIGLWWDCSYDTRLVSLEKMSFTDPHGGLKRVSEMIKWNASHWTMISEHSTVTKESPYWSRDFLRVLLLFFHLHVMVLDKTDCKGK